MIKFDVYDILNKKIDNLYINENVFDFYIRVKLISEVIRNYRFKTREGNRSNKSKAEVSGTNKKPFPQKGRGVARQGSYKNPHQRGGGVSFALKSKDYSYKISKKKIILSLKNCLSIRIKESSLFVIDDFCADNISTKFFVNILKNFNLSKVLFIDLKNINMSLSLRNLSNVKYLDINSINSYYILNYPKLLISKKAFLFFENKILKRNLVYFKE